MIVEGEIGNSIGTLHFIIFALGGGFIGSIITTFISSYFEHKRTKSDREHQFKKEIYFEKAKKAEFIIEGILKYRVIIDEKIEKMENLDFKIMTPNILEVLNKKNKNHFGKTREKLVIIMAIYFPELESKFINFTNTYTNLIEKHNIIRKNYLFHKKKPDNIQNIKEYESLYQKFCEQDTAIIREIQILLKDSKNNIC